MSGELTLSSCDRINSVCIFQGPVGAECDLYIRRQESWAEFSETCVTYVFIFVCVHSHNSLPHNFEGLFHKLPHAVHLPCGDDEILRLLRLQHQPHGLKDTKRDKDGRLNHGVIE